MNLHGFPVYPGDTVYEADCGYVTVESVTCDCIWVKLPKRTKRRYTKDGFAPRAKRPTLFWHPPPRIIFSKDSCVAQRQSKFLVKMIDMLNEMDACGDNQVTMNTDCDCECDCENSCGC